MDLSDNFRFRKSIFGKNILQKKFYELVDVYGSGYFDTEERWRDANDDDMLEFNKEFYK